MAPKATQTFKTHERGCPASNKQDPEPTREQVPELTLSIHPVVSASIHHVGTSTSFSLALLLCLVHGHEVCKVKTTIPETAKAMLS